MTAGKILNWIDDRLNPIVVKEVRQSVNGKALMGISMLFLIVQFSLLIIFITSGGQVSGKGGDLFTGILVILTYACIFGVGVTASVRFTGECAKHSMDLMHSTIIRPYQIISGKIFSAMVMVIYLFSLCIPFLAVAYFLRGISIPSVFFWISLVFIFMLPMMAFAVMVGSVPLSIIIRSVILVLVLFGTISLLEGAFQMSRYGNMDINLITLGWFTLIALSIAAGCFVIACAGVGHSASNILFPFRVYLLGLWLISVLIISGYSLYHDFSPECGKMLQFWSYASAFILTIVCAASSGERLEQTVRVLKELPKGKWPRRAYFLLSTGVVNNNIFCLILMLASITAAGCMVRIRGGGSDEMETFIFWAGLCAYSLFYSGLITYIRNRMKKFFPSINGFVYFMILGIGLTLIPFLVSIMIYLDFENIEKNGMYFFILSPASLTYGAMREIGLLVAVIGFLITVYLNRNYYREYTRKFFPGPGGAD